MSANYGIKISRKGVNVMDALTANNKRFFQLISTDGCLLVKEHSNTPSNTNKFFGYILTPDSDFDYYFGSLKEIEIANAGSGYTVHDVVNVVGGNSNARVWINGVDAGGEVTKCYVNMAGSNYEKGENIATTGGSGSGFTINILNVTGREQARAHPLNFQVGEQTYVIFENPM